MEKLITFMMYLLWILTIIIGLVAVFTDFKYEDVNALALFLVVFTAINVFFITAGKKKDHAE